MAGAQDRWKLVVVNPSLVVGPSLQDKPTSESFTLLRMLGDGSMKMGAPRMSFGAVDVRDLAQAHLAAAYLPDAEGRHIVSGSETDFLEMGQLLRPRFGEDYPLPKRALPKWLVWLVGPSQGMDRKYVSRNVNVPWRADNSKSRTALGMSYRPLQDSLEEMFAKMIGDGWFAK